MLRMLSSFVGFLLAIIVSVILFAPDRIPPGWGIEPVPVEVNVGTNLGGELIGALTGQSDKSVRIKNTHTSAIYNLQIILYNENKVIKKQFIKDVLPIKGVLNLGWAEQWNIETGDQIEVSAAAFLAVDWAL